MDSYAPSPAHFTSSREIEPIPVQTLSQAQLHSHPLFSSNNSVTNRMSWSEQFDTFMASQTFPMSSSLQLSRSPSPCPISLSPAPFSPGGYFNHVHTLEQDFCSNFSCCGLCLAGMHQLIDHFEENHAVVFGKDGRPIYPVTEDTTTPQTSSDSDMSHDTQDRCSSIIADYPQTHPPLSPSSMLSEGIGTDARLAFQTEHLSKPNRLFSDIMADFDPFDYDLSSSSSSAMSSASSSARSSPIPSQPICLPPSLLTIPPPSVNNDSDHDQDMLIDVVDMPPLSGAKTHGGTPKEKKQVHIGRPPKPRVFDVGGRRGKSVEGQSPQKRRDREKAYKCPHSGCSKQYLNPNGLKYHLEKGTCSIDPSYVPPAQSPAIATQA